MIQEIYYSHLSLSRLYALADKTNSLLKSRCPEQPLLVAVRVPLEAKMAVALKAIGSSTKSELSNTVRQADKNRDDAYIALKNYVKAGLRRRKEDYREACKALWEVLKQNDLELYKRGDDEESTSIESLVADLSTAENKARMELINAGEWLDELIAENKAFDAVSALRSADRVTDETTADSKANRELRAAYEMVRGALNSLLVMNDPVDIPEIVGMVSQYISESLHAAKLGEARKGPTEDDEQD